MSNARKLASNPAGVAKPIRGYYSNCVRVSAGPLLFISGQVALDPEGRIVGKGDVRAQTVQVLENIRMILRANGADMEDVVSVTVYVTDIAFLDRITTFACSTFRRTVRRAHRRDRQARDARATDRDSGRSRPALINRTSRASPFGIYRRQSRRDP